MGRDVTNTKLEDTPREYWSNSILYRLALATGLVDPVALGDIEVDADELLEEVEEIIYRYKSLET